MQPVVGFADAEAAVDIGFGLHVVGIGVGSGLEGVTLLVDGLDLLVDILESPAHHQVVGAGPEAESLLASWIVDPSRAPVAIAVVEAEIGAGEHSAGIDSQGGQVLAGESFPPGSCYRRTGHGVVTLERSAGETEAPRDGVVILVRPEDAESDDHFLAGVFSEIEGEGEVFGIGVGAASGVFRFSGAVRQVQDLHSEAGGGVWRGVVGAQVDVEVPVAFIYVFACACEGDELVRIAVLVFVGNVDQGAALGFVAVVAVPVEG